MSSTLPPERPTDPRYPTPLVTTAWLADRLGDPNLRVLDASWYLPAMGRDPVAEFRQSHIPGAAYFDLDAISDPSSPLPHMMPPPAQFARQVSELGVSNASFVVVYDGSGVNLSAPRAWWMLRAMGHEAVAVLDGGLGKWKREQRPVETGVAAARQGSFTATFRPELIRTRDDLGKNLKFQNEQVLDARSRGRFEGTEPEPRPGLRGGHIPGSRNLPYAQLVSGDGVLLPPAELARKFREAGVDPGRPVVTTCGSGTTACALLLGLQVLGAEKLALYDGSWAEWGRLPDNDDT